MSIEEIDEMILCLKLASISKYATPEYKINTLLTVMTQFLEEYRSEQDERNHN